MDVTKQLYQWDTGQELTECTGIYVDFLIKSEVYRIEVTDGTCIIPDELLQTSGRQKVWECMADNTLREFAFWVLPRPKPPGYVFTPTERLTFEGLVQKVDDAVADMIRRAESGEFDGHTPVKGTDYFTASEIQQIQNEVSSGAIGDFKSVVDTETETFNNNAETKLNAYNQNDSQKTTAYNANATQKLNAYNTNANNKVAEFDSHTEQIQSDVNKLKSDLTGLQTVVDSKADKTELVKTNLYLDALFKLNKGQTYDVLEQESEAYSVDVPSGAKYVGVDKVGGKSVVWNQIAPTRYYFRNGIYADYSDGIISLRGTATDIYGAIADIPTVAEHYYYLRTKTIANPNSMTFKFGSLNKLNIKPIADVGKSVAWISYQVKTAIEGIGFNNVDVGNSLEGIQLQLLVFDLTQMFGAGNEPSTVKEFEAMFPDDYYPYSDPTIISSQTDRVDMASADGTIKQQITTNFPSLNSAGSVYDYIDLNEGKLYKWTYIDGNEIKALTDPVITDITIPTELTDWMKVEAGGSITFHNADDGKRLLIPNKLSFVRKLDEVTV